MMLQKDLVEGQMYEVRRFPLPIHEWENRGGRFELKDIGSLQVGEKFTLTSIDQHCAIYCGKTVIVRKDDLLYST